MTFVRMDEEDRLGSAYTPARLDAVFKYDAWRFCNDPALARVRFASEFGFIVTKAHATTSKKRLRDLFEIFLTLRASKDAGALARLWQTEADGAGTNVAKGREFLRLAVKNEVAMRNAEVLLRERRKHALNADDVQRTLGPLL